MARKTFEDEFWPRSRRAGFKRREQEVGFFLLTCPQRHEDCGGLVEITPKEISESMADGWPVEQVEKALEELEGRKWLVRDGAWMFLVEALRDYRPSGDTRLRGAVKRLRWVPRGSKVWEAFLIVAEAEAPDLFKKFENEPPARPTHGASMPHETPVTTGDSMGHAGATDGGPRLLGTLGDARDTTDPEEPVSDLQVYGGGA